MSDMTLSIRLSLILPIIYSSEVIEGEFLVLRVGYLQGCAFKIPSFLNVGCVVLYHS